MAFAQLELVNLLMIFMRTNAKLKNYLVVWSNIFKTIVLIALIAYSNVSLGQNNSSSSLKHGIKTIVIDAGHGGKDPGTHGELTNEKTVVLAISLKLAEYIKGKYPYMKVILTRDSDEYLTLEERAEIANKNNADLFICIHANSASSDAHGAETYVLGLHRTESQQKLAERENSALLFEEDGEEKYKNFNLTPDAIIARQLQLSVNLDKSIDLASKIQSQFNSIGRRDRGVKQAGFWVLYKTIVPSLLIEAGFLTNKNEEIFLDSEEGQIKIANGIFRAFQEYVAEVDGLEALVENGSGYDASIEELGNTVKLQIFENSTEKKDAVYFKVQIITSSKKLSAMEERFKGVQVSEYEQDNLYKYTSGIFEDDFDSANYYKVEMRKRGFEHAFVVGFLNGERIPIAEAIKLSKK